MLHFYLKHKNCAKEDINNVQTVLDNNGVDPWWFDGRKGYPDDQEIAMLNN